MLLGHHLTEETSKRCMAYMGMSVLDMEERDMIKYPTVVEDFQVKEKFIVVST